MTKYPGLETLNATADASQILVYVNTVTNGYFGPMILYSFFIITFLGGFFMQMRTSGRPKFDVSLAVASFVSSGFCLILMLIPGFINVYHLGIMIGLAIVGVSWMYFGNSN